MKFCALTLAGLLATITLLAEPAVYTLDDTAIGVELSQPITITNKIGRSFVGHVESVGPTQLTFKTEAGAGEVIYTFNREEIDEITFPGYSLELLAFDFLDDGDFAQALPLLESLYRQRAEFLGLFGEEKTFLFTHLVEAYLQTGQPVNAIATARQLAPYIKDTRVSRQLRDAILLGHFKLQLYDDAQVLAKAWIKESKRYSDSALGWWVFAQIAFEGEDYDIALWTALQPIVFSGELPMAYLEHCYAVAIATCHVMEYKDKATVLFVEMRDRKLSWPSLPLLQRYYREYDQAAGGEEESEETIIPAVTTSPVKEPGEAGLLPPADSPIDKVRKIKIRTNG